MGHTGDDAIHKIPYKMKTQWRNQLKISVRVQFDILYRLGYQKIDVIFVQCPFNITVAFCLHVKLGIKLLESILSRNILYTILGETLTHDKCKRM